MLTNVNIGVCDCFMYLFSFVEGLSGFMFEGLAILLYAKLPGSVSLRVQHGFQLFQLGVTSLKL